MRRYRLVQLPDGTCRLQRTLALPRTVVVSGTFEGPSVDRLLDYYGFPTFADLDRWADDGGRHG